MADDRRVAEDYQVLQRVAGNRLAMTTFLAGFSLTAFAALAPGAHVAGFRWSDLRSWELDRRLLVAALLAVATLLFIFAAMSTYVAMQRVGSLSRGAVLQLDGSQAQPDLADRDVALVEEAMRIYVEPWRFLVLGLLLVSAAIVLECFDVDLLLGIVVGATAVVIVAGTPALHTNLRRVLLGRGAPS